MVSYGREVSKCLMGSGLQSLWRKVPHTGLQQPGESPTPLPEAPLVLHVLPQLSPQPALSFTTAHSSSAWPTPTSIFVYSLKSFLKLPKNYSFLAFVEKTSYISIVMLPTFIIESFLFKVLFPHQTLYSSERMIFYNILRFLDPQDRVLLDSSLTNR